MRRLHCWLCAVAALALTGLLLAQHAQAQERGKNGGQWGQKPPNAVDVRADGTLKGLSPTVAQVLGGQGEQWLVKVPRPQQITYNASAEADWLRPGMFVEFAASFDVKGNSTAPITQLSVFTPSADRPLGAQADAGIAAGADLFKSVDENAPKKPEQQSVSLKVAGRITGMRDGKISVAAGNANVVAELAEKCSISVSISDISMARPEDTVGINGWRMPNDPAHIYAQQLTINAKETLSSKRPAPEQTAAKPAVTPPPTSEKPVAPTTTVSKEDQEAALAELDNPAAGDKKD